MTFSSPWSLCALWFFSGLGRSPVSRSPGGRVRYTAAVLRLCRRAAVAVLASSAAAAQPDVREATSPARLDGRALDLDTLYLQLNPRALHDAAERGLLWLVEQQEPCGGWPADVGHKQGDDYMLLSTATEQKARGQAHQAKFN